MRYIENEELREFVKESLRKTIFQKAHALAVQTGCEILVKLKDTAGVYTNPLYYASDSYQEAYRKDGVREEPGEMFVQGETGLAIFPRVDSSTQSEKDEETESRTVSSVGTAQDITDDDDDTLIPMQLSMATDTNDDGVLKPKQESQTDDSQTQGAQDSSLSNVVVKLEQMDEEEVNSRLSAPAIGDATNNMLAGGGAQGTSFEAMDNSFGADQGDLNAGISARPYPIMSPKPYQCGVCGKAFRTVQVLQKHTQTFHMRPQMGVGRNRGRGGRGLYHGRPGSYRQLQTQQQARFMCVMCNRSFRSPDLLQDHMTRSHMTQPTPVQLAQTQQETFDPTTAQQTSQAPATATLQSLQQQQEQEVLASTGISFQPSEDPTAQIQISQSDPSNAFNVSSAASTSSTFMPPMSTPVFQGLAAGASTSVVGVPQSSPSRKIHRRPISRGSTFYRNNLVTSRGIMSAILLMSGPACTREAMNSNGPKMLRHITGSQFTSAATKLQEEGLGTLFSLKGHHAAQNIFIKKPPGVEISDGLSRNQDLCLIQEYAMRYNMRPPASIIRKWKPKLVAFGFVPEDHFKD